MFATYSKRAAIVFAWLAWCAALVGIVSGIAADPLTLAYAAPGVVVLLLYLSVGAFGAHATATEWPKDRR
jgi:hypothetical protein